MKNHFHGYNSRSVNNIAAVFLIEKQKTTRYEYFFKDFQAVSRCK